MSVDRPVLFTYFRSTAAYRVRIALNLKGLAHDLIPVFLGGEQHKPAFRSLNPQGLLPVFKDADVTLTQSLAIIEYLEDTLTNTPRLLPENAVLRAQVRSFSQVIASDTHPLNNLRVLQYLERQLAVNESQRLDWYRHWVAEGLHACEAMVEDYASSTFCFGASPTLADICLAAQMYNAERFDCPLTDYPILNAKFQNAMQLAAFQKAHPSVQPDTPKA